MKALGIILLAALLGGSARGQAADRLPWLKWDHATGDWNGNRALLEDRGVELLATYTAQVWGNLLGGIEPGAAYIGLLQFGLDVDLDKAIGWRGGSFRTTWIWIEGGQPSTDLVGGNLAISAIEAPPSFRALDLWLQQQLLDDEVTLRAGLFNADDEFTVSEYAALFQNSGNGWPVAFAGTAEDNPPAYPFATPGVFLAVEPGGGWKFQTAFLQGNAGSAAENPNNFRWNLGADNGFLFLNELHYRRDHARLPGTFKLGVIFDTSRSDLIEEDGEVWGDVVCYAIADQMLYREAGDDLQGLGGFVRAGLAQPDRNSVGSYLNAGCTYLGLVPGRDQDACGLALVWNHLTPGAARRTPGKYTGLEMALEVTYQAQLTPWFTLQPDVQFIIQPGNTSAAPNALVVGLSASIAF